MGFFMRTVFVGGFVSFVLLFSCSGNRQEPITCITSLDCPLGWVCVDSVCRKGATDPEQPQDDTTIGSNDAETTDTPTDIKIPSEMDAVGDLDAILPSEEDETEQNDLAIMDGSENETITADDTLVVMDDDDGGIPVEDDSSSIPDTEQAPDTDVCMPLDCGAIGFDCGGPFDDGCGGSIATCGECLPPATCGGGGIINRCGVPTPLPYPEIPDMQIKGLQPDFWPNYEEIAGNRVTRVAMNLVWALWGPAPKSPPCDPASEVAFDGRCYVIDKAVDTAIREYASRGVYTTAIVYGVPAWARVGNTACSPAGAGFEIFCAPDNPQEFGRFAGMLAFRYNGLNGFGRIIDFVIHNEVNSNVWYDIGCGSGIPCDKEAWISRYAADFNAAYDAIVSQQPTAKVLISFEHHFGSAFENLSDTYPTIAVENFLLSFAQKTGARQWRTAYHAYPPDLRYPYFSVHDWPRVTFGNIGVLAGFLRRTFPDKPWAWEIQLTENGISSHPDYSSEALQAEYLCRAFRNILGTPGITSFIYHRMKDHPVEVATGLSCGLATESGVLKQAWGTYALANRDDLNPPLLSCGFEYLPYVRLRRSTSADDHWVTTRTPPDGFTDEAAWRILRHEAPGTALIYECGVGSHAFPSLDPACEGQFSYGPMGWVYLTEQPGTLPLYRCRVGGGEDHFVSNDPACEGHNSEGLLGWVYPL